MKGEPGVLRCCCHLCHGHRYFDATQVGEYLAHAALEAHPEGVQLELFPVKP